VSALALPGSLAEEALQRAAWRRFELVCSPAILAELANVLARKFEWEQDRALEACREIADLAILVRPSRRLHILTDEPDNRLLECALMGKASCIVTGDKHMLKLKRYEGVSMIRLAEFLEQTK